MSTGPSLGSLKAHNRLSLLCQHSVERLGTSEPSNKSRGIEGKHPFDRPFPPVQHTSSSNAVSPNSDVSLRCAAVAREAFTNPPHTYGVSSALGRKLTRDTVWSNQSARMVYAGARLCRRPSRLLTARPLSHHYPPPIRFH